MNEITDYRPTVSTAIAKLASFQQVADLLNLFLSCEAEARLNDAEVDAGEGLFDTLAELRPECVLLAQGGAYVVTVKLEETNPEFGRRAATWVARDESGIWRSYCESHFAETAAEAVAMIFHADEIEAVSGNQAVIKTN